MLNNAKSDTLVKSEVNHKYTHKNKSLQRKTKERKFKARKNFKK